MLFWEPQVESVRQYLYYELALKHPVRGKMGIPVAAMVTEVPCVQDWITRFRHAEKKKCSVMEHVTKTYMITPVFSSAERTLQEFLVRAWNVSSENQAKEQSSKTIVHLCL